MLTSTQKAITAIAQADPSLSPKQVKAALLILSGDGSEQREPLDRLLSRREAAAILGFSVKSIDHYCRRGVLQRVTLGHSSRASGILESSVVSAMQSTVEGAE